MNSLILCSECREIRFLSQIRSLRRTVRPVIYCDQNRFVCPDIINLSAWVAMVTKYTEYTVRWLSIVDAWEMDRHPYNRFVKPWGRVLRHNITDGFCSAALMHFHHSGFHLVVVCVALTDFRCCGTGAIPFLCTVCILISDYTQGS